MASAGGKALQRGAGGAAAGAAFGPWGALIGGGIGGLSGLLEGDDSTAPQDAAAAAGQAKIQNIGEATRLIQEQRAKMAAQQMQQLNNRMANYQGANNVLASMYGGGGQGGRGPATMPSQQNQAAMGSIRQGPALDRLAQMIPQSIPAQQNQMSMGSIAQGPALSRLPMPAQIPVQQNQTGMGSVRQGPSFGNLLTPDVMNSAAQQAAMGTLMGGPGQAAPMQPMAPSAMAQSGILQRLGGLGGLGMSNGIGRLG